MKVNIEGVGEIKIDFQHNTEHVKHTQAIAEYNGHKYMGCATLANGDRYCRAIGRRVALHDLMRRGFIRLEECAPTAEHPSMTHHYVKDLGLSREQRRQVWSAYFAQHADLRRGK